MVYSHLMFVVEYYDYNKCLSKSKIQSGNTKRDEIVDLAVACSNQPILDFFLFSAPGKGK